MQNRPRPAPVETATHRMETLPVESPSKPLILASSPAAVQAAISAEVRKAEGNVAARTPPKGSFGDSAKARAVKPTTSTNAGETGLLAQITHADHLRSAELVGKMLEQARNQMPPELSYMIDAWLHPETADAAAQQAADRWLAESAGVVLDRACFALLPILVSGCPTAHLYMDSCPLALLLKAGANPSALSGPPPPRYDESSKARGSTMLHWLGEMVGPTGGTPAANQLVVAKMLLTAGADPNARAGHMKTSYTPLHVACHSGTVVSLGFIDLLLRHGADANLQNSNGHTPLMSAMPFSAPAALHLLEYAGPSSNANTPPLDVDVATPQGGNALGAVRSSLAEMNSFESLTDDPFALAHVTAQLTELERALVARGATDGGWLECEGHVR